MYSLNRIVCDSLHQHFSTIDLNVSEEGHISVQKPVHHFVTAEYDEHPEWAAYVKKNLSLLGTAHLRLLAHSSQDLDGRFLSIRTRETGLGNFICDVSKSLPQFQLFYCQPFPSSQMLDLTSVHLHPWSPRIDCSIHM